MLALKIKQKGTEREGERIHGKNEQNRTGGKRREKRSKGGRENEWKGKRKRGKRKREKDVTTVKRELEKRKDKKRE